MKINRIVKKDEKNAIVYLDNNEKLYLTFEVIMMNGLKKNQEISEDHFSFLIKENQKFHIKQRAFRLLGRRLHSINELRIKLMQKKYEKDLIENVIDELVEKDYLNDYKFSILFSEEKIRSKLWGKNKIKGELIKRRVDTKIISQVIEEKFPEGNSIEDAVQIALKKFKSLSQRNTEPKKIEAKLYSFLFSRGYDFETSREAIQKIIKEI